MAYTVNKTDGSICIPVDGAIDAHPKPTLIGRNKTNYGEPQQRTSQSI